MGKFVLSKKYWIAGIAVVGLVGWGVFGGSKSVLPEGVEIGVVGLGEVLEVVSETGYVKASQAVEMAFERGGRVTEVLVESGSVVEAGDVLMKLDSASAEADLVSAYARLEAEQVRLRELLSGADTNSLAVTKSAVVSAETALANAKRNLEEVIAQQNQLVVSAEKTLRSTGLQAYLVSEEKANSSYVYTAPTITGTYNSEVEGVYRLELYSSGAPSGASYRVLGLENMTEAVSTVSPTPVGTRGLFVQFPNNFAKQTEWEIPIPNTRSASYLTNLNTYQAVVEGRKVAIATAESAVKVAEANLKQSQTQLTQVSGSARDERVLAQQALVKQMEASVISAQVQYDHLTLKAPFAGKVTKVSVDPGVIVSPTVPVVSLISGDNYELVVNISESDIQEINIGDTATVIFDAYDDGLFEAKVIRISPSAEVSEGVRSFEMILQFINQDDRIRAGLSADIDILAEKRTDVIVVPTRAIVEQTDGKFVRTWDGTTLNYLPVKTGLRGSNGMTEIVSGLTEGTEIITFAREADIEKLEAN
ncbi:MAG: efflux RND transporter periplasmic adaptor subunit [Candidatus Paceibacterota bacterium]